MHIDGAAALPVHIIGAAAGERRGVMRLVEWRCWVNGVECAYRRWWILTRLAALACKLYGDT